MTHVQFAPRRAFRAARILANDPDDLPQVFTIIESLSLDTMQRIASGFRRSESGRALLAKKPDIVDVLADRAALARLPEGSLGRAYLDFVERENISAQGIRDAAAKGATLDKTLPAPLDWVHARMRDTHDLWHAATGYHGDVLGETALLAFSLAQTKNPAIGLIVGIGLVKTSGASDAQMARATILDGFRRGWKAAWLPSVDWESLLALPVEEVRRRLNLEAPRDYRPIRSAEIKAQRAAA
ncbi:Coq4 family protein [Vitiosangium sp. GDMCC 1.1324]|uniref:Coq4 family protein n=1 Tax=Vitiosangium sp. (strain GDMCC 1.1324) TaxID=2138576 RepID=UPI00130E86CA|nr:Coq4 family protein [Vitiosangium sp. GDMCC 1.1324]